jgi:site-specific DNA recombinase
MTGIPSTPPKRRGRRAHTPTDSTVATGPRLSCVYVRRSTDDEHQLLSLDAQRAALEKHVRIHAAHHLVAPPSGGTA